MATDEPQKRRIGGPPKRTADPVAGELGTQRATLPALRQEVHTFTRLLVPLITVRTDWMFGFQRREVRRCEWETLLPKLGCLAQMSHVEEATVVS